MYLWTGYNDASPLLIDVDTVEYSDNEKTELNLEFVMWDYVPENVKLFVIGGVFTKLPVIIEKWGELE